MRITLNKRTALMLLRLARRKRGASGIRRRRVGLLDPDPSPAKHWTQKLLRVLFAQAGANFDAVGKAEVCVSSLERRLKSKFVSCTVYGKGLPEGPFLELTDGVAVSSPELLFVELANEMSLPEHLLLGFELTGRFARDPYRPVEGAATFDVPPVTSVKRIRAFLDSSRHLNGAGNARRTLALLADETWSPFEAVVAVMMSLPWEEYGYGFGRCELNPRIKVPEHLVGSAHKESRVPDILVGGTRVGVNYDGGDHLKLGAIANAGIALGRDPGNGHIAAELDRAIDDVRAKYVDDGRRDRELAADGYSVRTVFKEDLYQFGGLDRVMMQVMEALKLREGWDVGEYQRILQLEFARKERQALLQSMIPGRDLELPADVEEAFVKLPRRNSPS